MAVHVVLNQKGGVGKSTTAVNLAAVTADVLNHDDDPESSSPVLALSVDPQGSAVWWASRMDDLPFHIAQGHDDLDELKKIQHLPGIKHVYVDTPGWIDLSGDDLWVPVAQYRPDSSAEIDHVDLRTLRVTRLFTVEDHIGGIVYDPTTGRLIGNTWGSRTFYEWTRTGRALGTWRNPENLLDFQDCQYVPAGKMACGGITGLPQTPAAGGTAATYELGGVALIDLHRRIIINEFPFQQWSAAGHVLTRNPLKFAATGRTLTMWAAPDNGEEIAGTQIYTWQATLG